MKNKFITVMARQAHLIALIVLPFFVVALAAKETDAIAQAEKLEVIVKANLPLPQIEAKAWALYEFESGILVAGKNATDHYPPASITKLMTNYVTFESLKHNEISLDDSVSISEKAWRTEGSRMFAEVGSTIPLQHLLKSTIIQSGNDAAVAIADHIGGSELQFSQIMNRTAQRLQMNDSQFVNATGLPDDRHFMSASDIAKLAKAIISEYPEFYAWYAEKEYKHNNITQYNRNKLLWKDPSVDGLKTGHTEAAGYCLVGSAIRDGRRWIAVVLGAEDERSRENAVQALLDYAFAAYVPFRTLDEQGGLASVPVYKGEVDEVLLKAAQAVNIVVPTGREKDVAVELQLSPYYQAPIEIGQAMGVATLSLDGSHLADVSLISMSTIKKGGLWKQFIDGMSLRWREFRE